jgi:hypothetical protein
MTIWNPTVGDVMKATTPANEVCDSCCDVAYDDGITDWAEQQTIMRELGSELADHLCDQRETDGEIRCACLCIRSF